MKPLYRGVLLALLHILIVCSLGAKLLYDRGHRPRVWIKVAPVDPDLPIRGAISHSILNSPARGSRCVRSLLPGKKTKMASR